MEYPQMLKYTKDHEWLMMGEGSAKVGITDYAQNALGDVVFVELPKVGDAVERSKSIAVVESVKSVSDVYAPLSGQITKVNEMLDASPEALNKDPYGEGWLFEMTISDESEVKELLDAGQYQELIGSE